MAEIDAAGEQVVVNRQSIVSMDSDGFTFNQLEAAAFYHIYLAIRGGSWSIGDLLTQTDTSTVVTESGLPTQPKSVLFVSANRAMDVQNTGTVHGQLSIGAGTSTSNRVAMAIMDEDNLATSETSSAIEFDEVYIHINTSDTLEGLGDINSITSDGFTFIMDDADPAQMYVWWVAAGDNPSANAIPVFMNQYRQRSV
jgi:hypothetical protein